MLVSTPQTPLRPLHRVTVFTWGRNDRGQCGLGPRAPSAVAVPSEVRDLADIRRVSAGASHTLAVGESGSLYAWGEHALLGLGNDERWRSWALAESDASPRLVRPLQGVRIAEASAGHQHSLCVDDTGALYSFGALFVLPSPFAPSCFHRCRLPLLGIHQFSLNKNAHIVCWRPITHCLDLAAQVCRRSTRPALGKTRPRSAHLSSRSHGGSRAPRLGVSTPSSPPARPGATSSRGVRTPTGRWASATTAGGARVFLRTSASRRRRARPRGSKGARWRCCKCPRAGCTVPGSTTTGRFGRGGGAGRRVHTGVRLRTVRMRTPESETWFLGQSARFLHSKSRPWGSIRIQATL